MMTSSVRFSGQGLRLAQIFHADGTPSHTNIHPTTADHKDVQDDEIQLRTIMLNPHGDNQRKTVRSTSDPVVSGLVEQIKALTQPDGSAELPETFRKTLKELIGKLQQQGFLTKTQADQFTQNTEDAEVARPWEEGPNAWQLDPKGSTNP